MVGGGGRRGAIRDGFAPSGPTSWFRAATAATTLSYPHCRATLPRRRRLRVGRTNGAVSAVATRTLGLALCESAGSRKTRRRRRACAAAVFGRVTSSFRGRSSAGPVRPFPAPAPFRPSRPPCTAPRQSPRLGALPTLGAAAGVAIRTKLVARGHGLGLCCLHPRLQHDFRREREMGVAALSAAQSSSSVAALRFAELAREPGRPRRRGGRASASRRARARRSAAPPLPETLPPPPLPRDRRSRGAAPDRPFAALRGIRAVLVRVSYFSSICLASRGSLSRRTTGSRVGSARRCARVSIARLARPRRSVSSPQRWPCPRICAPCASM